MNKRKYYIVSAEALPEIFIKVAEAKRMLQVGEAATVGEAARKMGISRSAFYKYKDAVQPFQDMKAGHIITFYALLKDMPGVLSKAVQLENRPQIPGIPWYFILNAKGELVSVGAGSKVLNWKEEIKKKPQKAEKPKKAKKNGRNK